jgi:hypothetical protein
MLATAAIVEVRAGGSHLRRVIGRATAYPPVFDGGTPTLAIG